MTELLIYTLVSLVTCVTPGAGVLFTLTSAFRYGRPNFWKAPLGNTVGVLIMSVISATGLGAIIAASSTLFYGIQAASALVLIYLGYKNWTAPARDLSLGAQGAPVRESPNRVFWEAVVLQATNPMLIVFLLSLMPQFMHPQDNYVVRITLLSAIFVICCLLVHLCYSFIAVTASQWLKGPKFSMALNKISAVLFWILAVMVFVSFITDSAPA